MSMFKKIKSLFIIEENIEDINKKIKEKGKTEVKTDNNVTIDVSDGNVSQASLDKFLKVLADAMEKANIEWYDYLEFKQAVRSLDKLENDEAKRYLTSFTMAKTMGAEKESLKQSAGYYLDVLKKEEAKFNESFKKQVDSRVLNRKQTLDNLHEKRGKKEEQIKQLQLEIEKFDAKIGEVQKQMDNASKKMASVKLSFTKAYELIVNQINQDISKIDQYLK